MKSTRVPLDSWEAVVPGVVFPLLALWLGGSDWTARGIAAAANLAPLLTLAVLTFVWGRLTPAVQGAATFAYGTVALGWIATKWDVPGLQALGEHAALRTPLAAAAIAVVVFAAVALALRLVGWTRPISSTPA